MKKTNSFQPQHIDPDFLMETLQKLIQTPSPVGYYEKGNPLLQTFAEKFGFPCFTDERHCFYIKVEGREKDRTVLVGSHMDTLGYLVKFINADGSIAIKSLGGVNNHSLEHEEATLHTRTGQEYTGYITLKHHSVHVFDDAREMARDDANMMFLLDADAKNADEVRALGVEVGDVIAPEPHFHCSENGRIRSRFLDDKAAVAASLSVLNFLEKSKSKPRYTTLFAFPYYEEVNAGGSYVPDGVREYVAIDIGVIGPENTSTERALSIVAGDRFMNYDRELTGLLINLAKREQIPYSVEVFHRYSTDAMCSFLHGNNLKHAAFGMPVFTSHGIERTYKESIFATAELCLAYVLRE